MASQGGDTGAAGGLFEQGRAAPFLRVILTFLKEFGEEQLKQIPGVGPAVTALLELSKELDGKKLEQRVDSLLAVGRQTQEDIQLLTAISAATFFHQAELARRLEGSGRNAGSSPGLPPRRPWSDTGAASPSTFATWITGASRA